MTKLKNKEQNFELLLENMIRIQGKLIEKVDRLSRQMNQVENTFQQTSQREPLPMTFLCRNDLQPENSETRKM